MTTIRQKKLQLSDMQKDINKRLKDFEEHRAKLNALRNPTIEKPKSKKLFAALFSF